MEEQQKNTPQNNEDAPPASKPKPVRAPSVRTMKSDMDDLFRTTKPSLIQIMGKDAAMRVRVLPQHNQFSFFKKFLVSLVIVLLLAGGGALFFLTQKNIVSPPPPESPKTPSPLFSVEDTELVSGGFSNRVLLLQKIEDAMRGSTREGTFRHIPLEISEKNQKRWATFDDIIALYRLEPSPELIVAAEGPVMLFSYSSGGGPRTGFAFRVRDVNRALRGLLVWESLLLKDMTPFFFGSPIQATVAPFEDRTFRNIDERFLVLSPEKDLGIAYSLFPAKQILILTTGQEALETAINRLYEQ